jgi:N-methylhydantoinase A
MTAEAVALSVFRIAVVNVAQAIRQTTVQRGRDPRDFAILPYGGGGALFAASVAEAMEIDNIVVPPSPGIFSAFGLTASEIRLDFTQADPGRKLAGLDAATVRGIYDSLAARARAEFAGFGVATDGLVQTWLADARYAGQGFELTVRVDPAALDREGARAIANEFHAAHAARYGYAFQAQAVEIVAWRLEAKIPRDGVLPAPAHVAAMPAAEPRTVRLDGAEQWATYERALLPVGTEFDGPALVVEPTSATAVPAGWRLSVDRFGNLRLSRRNREAE